MQIPNQHKTKPEKRSTANGSQLCACRTQAQLGQGPSEPRQPRRGDPPVQPRSQVAAFASGKGKGRVAVD